MIKKAFTLIELLVVLMILGILASVAVPKFIRVYESHKVVEAEEMLVALRTEQEQRCIMGKQYQTSMDKMALFSTKDTGKNFTYTLQGTGATAARVGKDYEIKMLSYKTGELCCSGSGCAGLNKEYPACGNVTISDECAREISCDGVSVQSCGCKNAGSQSRSCDTNTGVWSKWGSCSIADACSCNASTKPAISQACGCNHEGTQTRTVTCNIATGEWHTPGEWSECSAPVQCNYTWHYLYNYCLGDCWLAGSLADNTGEKIDGAFQCEDFWMNDKPCISKGLICYVDRSEDNIDISSNDECRLLGYCYGYTAYEYFVCK